MGNIHSDSGAPRPGVRILGAAFGWPLAFRNGIFDSGRDDATESRKLRKQGRNDSYRSCSPEGTCLRPRTSLTRRTWACPDQPYGAGVAKFWLKGTTCETAITSGDRAARRSGTAVVTHKESKAKATPLGQALLRGVFVSQDAGLDERARTDA